MKIIHLIFNTFFFISVISTVISIRKNRALLSKFDKVEHTENINNKQVHFSEIKTTTELKKLLDDDIDTVPLEIPKALNEQNNTSSTITTQSPMKVISADEVAETTTEMPAQEFSTISYDDLNNLNTDEPTTISTFTEENKEDNIKIKDVKDKKVVQDKYEEIMKPLKKLHKQQLILNSRIQSNSKQLKNNLANYGVMKTKIVNNEAELGHLNNELKKLLDENEELGRKVKSKKGSTNYRTNDIKDYESKIKEKLNIIEREYKRANQFLSEKNKGIIKITSVLESSKKRFEDIKMQLEKYNKEMAILVSITTIIIKKLFNIS